MAFNGSKTIDEVSVFSLQDTYTAPVEPTATMTFFSFGLRAFQIQVLGRRGLGQHSRRGGDEQQPGLAQVHIHAGDDHEDTRVHHGGAERVRTLGGSGGVGGAVGRLARTVTTEAWFGPVDESWEVLNEEIEGQRRPAALLSVFGLSSTVSQMELRPPPWQPEKEFPLRVLRGPPCELLSPFSRL